MARKPGDFRGRDFRKDLRLRAGPRRKDEPGVGKISNELDSTVKELASSPQILEMAECRAPKTKKGLKGSIDDVLGDLLGDEMTLPEKPVKLASCARDAMGVAQVPPSSRARTKSLLKNDALSTMAGLEGADAEDLDDMDADLLGLKKFNLASSKRAAKDSGKEELPSNPKPANMLIADEKGNTIPTKKAPPPSSFGRQFRKFSCEDLEDPLAGLLSDEEEGTATKPLRTESITALEESPAPVRDQGPSSPLTPGDTPVRKKEEFLFDEGDDIMAALGFGDSPKAERRQTGDQQGSLEGPRPARSTLDELLGRATASKLLARPGPGEHREFELNRKYQRAPDEEDTWDDEDFTFGAYQPTVGSSKGQQSHRQLVSRFLAEGGTDPKAEPDAKQSSPSTPSPSHPRRGGADWLGLKDNSEPLPPSPTREAKRGGSSLSTPSLPAPKSQHSAPGQQAAPAGLPLTAKPPPEGAGSPAKASQASQLGAAEKEEEEDWLSHALARKKSRGLAREERTKASEGQNSVGAAGQPPSDSRPVASTQGLKQAAAGGTSGTATQKPPTRLATSGSSVTWNQDTLALHAGDLKKGTAPGDLSGIEPAVWLPSSQEPTGLSVPVQPLLPESVARSLLPSIEYQRQLQSSTVELRADLLQSQARLAELEAQVQKLELERTQHQLLLESLQQRHKADLELIEGAHRSRVKVLETSYLQREERLRRENEELSARYLSHCQEAEQARAELTAQHQRRLAAAAQEKDQEMERLQELQRASILEMRRDHEEQLQHLKLLKDREINAVTSATSHTRSLNGIIEQMEKFSGNLHELQSRVEASHLATTQERELGAQQRDGQLRVLQERLARQQRDLEEERSRLQEVTAKMEARLGEQSRLLEQERWRVNAEQSKAESTQRALEEQRRVMVQQITMEREELERAKSALLEEQKSVMHKCGEERRRLAAEWAEFFAQQKLSKERAEREAERALQVDTQREGALISLAKEQAELKVRARELRAQEDQLAAEREALERERQKVQLEKERVSAVALRLRLRAKEVESTSQVASAKHEEGERALREALQVPSGQQAQLQLVQQRWLQEQEPHMRQARPLPALAAPTGAPHLHPPSYVLLSGALGQGHLSLAQQRLQLDHVQQTLPSSHEEPLPGAQGLEASCLSATLTPAPGTPGFSPLLAGLGSLHLHAELALLRHTAEQDRDFLEDEQFFLETLMKASYNMTSHSA
ncbi:fas-binding factor 1 isoform X2 [Manis pentadactyla]|uniref:fas-binding factor 1 isoform X2 n=3 Tax=Manis pentadactyla TaxID=143292 RepID=UPI00255C90A6|nr:fas-binding factor 1 isoform X2 [Manis pentadactyla]